MNKFDVFFLSVNWKPTMQEYQEAVDFFSTERKVVREFLYDLHWDQSLARQKIAREYLAKELKPGEYIHLIAPYNDLLYDFLPCDKGIWENAAKIISNIGYPKIDSIIIPCFVWLLDGVWPGRDIIYDLLLTLPSKILLDKMHQVEMERQKYHKNDYADLLEIFSDIREDMC